MLINRNIFLIGRGKYEVTGDETFCLLFLKSCNWRWSILFKILPRLDEMTAMKGKSSKNKYHHCIHVIIFNSFHPVRSMNFLDCVIFVGVVRSGMVISWLQFIHRSTFFLCFSNSSTQFRILQHFLSRIETSIRNV